jgi:beta-phosphoglucomutase-like phosphatase (HAD superfamily)
MRYARAVGIRQGIATNGSSGAVNVLLKALELTQPKLQELGIEEIVTAADVSNAKPAPHVYLELARRLGVHPSGCVAIEDTQNGGLQRSLLE